MEEAKHTETDLLLLRPGVCRSQKQDGQKEA
jgi:hypothetical protein